jgi:hypothetical protein
MYTKIRRPLPRRELCFRCSLPVMLLGLADRFRCFFPCLVVLGMYGLLSACGEDDPSQATDSSVPDSGLSQDSGLDGAIDSGMDSGPPDGSQPDTGTQDTGTQDAPDAELDAGTDAAMPSVPPMHLSETGLYLPGSLTELAEGVMAYVPRYALWSDGADKLRYLLLPQGETIDTSDPDAFVFPIGTKAWKEFSLEGTRLETRLLWKTDNGWIHVAYAWNEAQDDAVATTRGASNVLGTEHDIPQRSECRECHGGAGDTLLGVSAVQLAHDGAGVTLSELQADGWLSDAMPADIARPDTLEWNALGYLHANCGNCHNPRGIGFDRVDMDLWLRTAELGAVTSTQSYLTTVDVAPEQTAGDDTARVEPGASGDSVLITRMKLRGAGNDQAMPPFASELTDDAGILLVEEWIDSL